jgi:hypothetical protein
MQPNSSHQWRDTNGFFLRNITLLALIEESHQPSLLGCSPHLLLVVNFQQMMMPIPAMMHAADRPAVLVLSSFTIPGTILVLARVPTHQSHLATTVMYIMALASITNHHGISLIKNSLQ